MEEKTNVFKIIVNATHELTDVVKDIHNSKADRVVLTFTDHTDLLISPINLKVLQEVAEKEKKVLIAQIIQNPTGVRNSRLAGIKVIETPSSPTEQDWQDALEEIEKKSRGEVSKKKIQELAKEEEVATKTTSFEDRVNSALSKSREERYVDKRGESKKDEFISIDNDLPSERGESLAGKDFATMPEQGTPPVSMPTRQPLTKNRFKPNFSFINFKNKKFLRAVIIALIALLLVPGISFAIYNQMVPIVKVKIFVEAKPVEISKTFVGDPNIDKIDFDNLKIPIKTGEATKSLSDTIVPTGKAFKGEKAKGSVTLTYFKAGGCGETDLKISLAIGHTIVTDKYSYKLTAPVEITCNGMGTVEVVAADIGEEYNIASGKPFSVQGYGSEIYGLNSAAFTGGTKEEYTVLSQQDLDSAIEKLSTTAIEEVKSELRDKETSWDIIENSMKSEVDKTSIKTDKKVGEEASIVNLDITIKGTATYYFTKDLNEGLTALLREEAVEKNLFESDSDLELVLGDDIEKKLTVDDTVKDAIQIKLEAKSSVKPKISKDDIENALKGMSFEDGLKYIETLDYSDQKTVVQFIPNNYPEFLKRFPNRRGGVLVTIEEIKITE